MYALCVCCVWCARGVHAVFVWCVRVWGVLCVCVVCGVFSLDRLGCVVGVCARRVCVVFEGCARCVCVCVGRGVHAVWCVRVWCVHTVCVFGGRLLTMGRRLYQK